MSENNVKWHPYPEEQIPKNIKRVFVTLDFCNYLKSVGIFCTNSIYSFNDKLYKVTAWAELYDYYEKPTKKSENYCDWKSKDVKRPIDGKHVVTIVEYGRRNKKYVDTLYSYMGMFVNTDKSVIAYTDMPEPYEKKV